MPRGCPLLPPLERRPENVGKRRYPPDRQPKADKRSPWQRTVARLEIALRQLPLEELLELRLELALELALVDDNELASEWVEDD